MIRVLFVCCGNTCRSPMAESVFTHMVKERGLEKDFFIRSSGTSSKSVGNSPSYGTVSKLDTEGIHLVPHRARQMSNWDYSDYDYLIAMDSANVHNMKKICGGDPEGKIHLLLEFTGSVRDIADPYYTRDYDTAFNDISLGLKGFLQYLLTVESSQ